MSVTLFSSKSSENLYKKFEDEKEKKSIQDLGTYKILHSGGYGKSYYVGASEYIYETNTSVIKKRIEGHYERSINPDKAGPKIQLYTGCPFKEDGEHFAILHITNWLSIKRETYYSLGLDSDLVTFFDTFIKKYLYYCCIFVECGGECMGEACNCRDSIPSCTDSANLVKEPLCVIPLSEYISQSQEKNVLWDISRINLMRNLCVLKVKNGEIVSISLDPENGRTVKFHGDNFIVTYINLNKSSEDETITSSLNDFTVKNAKGYLTKRLKVSYLSNTNYINNLKTAINILDPDKKFTSEYKDIK